MKKILALILIIGIPIIIYLLTIDNKVYYVALGDSLAVGQNPYGQVSYGYADYVANDLKVRNKLETYTKKFAVSGYRTTDLLNDIRNNRRVLVDDKAVTIKHAMTKADVLTLSIGMNELFYKMGINEFDLAYYSETDLKKYVDQVVKDVDKLIIEIKKYCKEDIILIGYYNPLWHMKKSYAKEIDPVFVYANEEMKKLCQKYNLYYIDIHKLLEKNPNYFPNPIDIHPSYKGYDAIAYEVTKIINRHVLN